jgi:hypothetical protein
MIPMSSISNLDDFRALDPFFRIIEQALAGLVDGEHFLPRPDRRLRRCRLAGATPGRQLR